MQPWFLLSAFYFKCFFCLGDLVLRLNWNGHVSVNCCWLTEAFAVVREAAKRKLGMRHFDVQVSLFLSVLKKKKGFVLHDGDSFLYLLLLGLWKAKFGLQVSSWLRIDFICNCFLNCRLLAERFFMMGLLQRWKLVKEKLWCLH